SARSSAMPVEAKICGLSTPDTLDAAVAGGARFVGVVTFPKSPRHISTETMRTLGARVPKGVARGGLFVDPYDALLDEKLATGGSFTARRGRSAWPPSSGAGAGRS